jgi:hypothetical protein
MLPPLKSFSAQPPTDFGSGPRTLPRPGSHTLCTLGLVVLGKGKLPEIFGLAKLKVTPLCQGGDFSVPRCGSIA